MGSVWGEGVDVASGCAWALALGASESRVMAMKDANAIRARAAMGFGLGNLGSEGLRRDESRLRSEDAISLRRFIRTYEWGGGILIIRSDY